MSFLPPAFGAPPPTRPFPWELLWAGGIIALITLGYVGIAGSGIPRPSGFLGHGLGVGGFLLMLATEILYPLRKRTRRLQFGQMNRWLQFHIVTGLVGPYLVLLHSGWKFHGLAGLLTLLTGLMVLSGFVGRYIYTAVPRTPEGAEASRSFLIEQVQELDRNLAELGVPREAVPPRKPVSGWLLVLGRPWLRWQERRRIHRALALSDLAGNRRSAARCLGQRFRLELQRDSLAATRRLMAWWYFFHIPLSATVFTLAFVHVAGALYFATFLK